MATPRHPGSRASNMTDAERIASIIAGGLLAIYGLRRRDTAGMALGLVGSGIALSGWTGHSGINDWLDIHRFAGAGGPTNVLRNQGVRIERTITVSRPIDDVYRFWRQLENLPRFMKHLISVRSVGPNVYRWVAKGPLGSVEWDAEVIEEQVPWLIAWRTVPGSRINNAGSVRFSPAPGGRGTEVQVALAYKPPAGALGAMIARLLGEEPHLQVRDDLSRFKHIMEAGDRQRMLPGRTDRR